MPDYADLEIGIYRWDETSYAVDLRYSQAGADPLGQPAESGPTVRFDHAELLRRSGDPADYGTYLSRCLFAEPEVLSFFAESQGRALGTPGTYLRVRLYIFPNAAELHRYRWETLRHPVDNSWLATNERVLFSRFLLSPYWRPIRPLAGGGLSALVAIANPRDLSEYEPGERRLAPIDAAGELERAVRSLDGLHVDALAPAGLAGSVGNATLENLIAEVRKGYDVLYLVCHGALIRDEPKLWLEDAHGDADVVSGEELAERLRALQDQPRLVVLASCQGAGEGDVSRTRDEGALSALGPRLAEAGIPAVVGMQGNFTMETARDFLPAFFRELRQPEAAVDGAMATARAVVGKRPDSWMPVLFMRLRTGRLWYTPGLAAPGSNDRFAKWEALLNNIDQGECTPILGPGLNESLFGSSRETARRWADTFRFPMSPHDAEDLPQVAQYLAEIQDKPFPRGELTNYLRRELRRKFAAGLEGLPAGASLGEMISRLGTLNRGRAPGSDPYAVLAALPCKLYVTTNSDRLMADALREASASTPGNKKVPTVGAFHWERDTEPPGTPEDAFAPDRDHPLVYHLFGQLEDGKSLVLTEDDHFDFLINVTGRRLQLPLAVRTALTDSALLFLGFRMDDWGFRVLFRSIMRQQSRGLLNGYAHVAVQIDPEQGRVIEPELARRYLERYFQGGAITIYWGSVAQFIEELADRWVKYQLRQL